MALFWYVVLILVFLCFLVFVKWLIYLRRYDEAVELVNKYVRLGISSHRLTKLYDVSLMANHFCDVIVKSHPSPEQISHCGSLMISYFEEKLDSAKQRMRGFYLRVLNSVFSVVLSWALYRLIRYVGELKEFWVNEAYDEITMVLCLVAVICVLLAVLLSVPSFKTSVDNADLAYQLWLISISIQMCDSTKSPATILAESYDYAPLAIRMDVARLIQIVRENEAIVEPYSFVMNALKDKSFESMSIGELLRLRVINMFAVAPYFIVFAKIVLDVVEVIKQL